MSDVGAAILLWDCVYNNLRAVAKRYLPMISSQSDLVTVISPQSVG